MPAMAKTEKIAQNASMAELRIRGMPEDLRKNLRLVALQEGVSMNQWVIDTLQAAVDERGVSDFSLLKTDPKKSKK